MLHFHHKSKSQVERAAAIGGTPVLGQRERRALVSLHCGFYNICLETALITSYHISLGKACHMVKLHRRQLSKGQQYASSNTIVIWQKSNSYHKHKTHKSLYFPRKNSRYYSNSLRDFDLIIPGEKQMSQIGAFSKLTL